MRIEWHCANCNKVGIEDIQMENIFKERNKGESLMDIILNMIEKIHEEQERFRRSLTEDICKEPLIGIKTNWEK